MSLVYHTASKRHKSPRRTGRNRAVNTPSQNDVKLLRNLTPRQLKRRIRVWNYQNNVSNTPQGWVKITALDILRSNNPLFKSDNALPCVFTDSIPTQAESENTL